MTASAVITAFFIAYGRIHCPIQIFTGSQINAAEDISSQRLNINSGAILKHGQTY